MREATVFTLLVATLAVGGCGQAAVGPDVERPAPPNQFVVTTGAGARLTGPAARIDIRHVDTAKPPDVEVTISASGGSGHSWSMVSAAAADFLKTLSLTARVVDGRLEPGTASVQARRDSTDSAAGTAADAGLLSLRLYSGRLMGEASRMDAELAATFDGPFVVTCAVPASVMAGNAPVPTAGDVPPSLTVDQGFESELCRPYATLGGWSR